MKVTKYLSTLLFTGVLSFSFSTIVFANTNNELRPKGCDRMSIMTITTKVKITSSSVKCIKYVVKNGGRFHFDVFATDTTVIVVQPGGKLTSEEDVFAIINRGGEVNIIDGTITFLRSEAGITKITSEADVNDQSGNAAVELDNSLIPKK